MYEGFWQNALRFLLLMPLTLPLVVFPYLTLTRLLPPANKRWRKLLLVIGTWVAVGTIIFVGDPVNVLAAFPIFLLAVWLGTQEGPLAKCAVSLIFFTMCVSISALLDNVRAIASINIGFIALPRIIMWTPIFFYVRRLRKRVEAITLSDRLWWLLIGMSVAPFAAVMAGISLAPERSADTAILVMMPFALLSGLALLTAIFTLSRQQQLEQMSQLSQFHRSYYDQLEQQQAQVRRLRHDMTNQLQTLSALPPAEVAPYLQQLLDSPAMRPARRYSDNPVINVILTAKAGAMEDARICFDCAAQLPAQLPFAQTDLCAIFCNALDNAIEASLPLPDAQRQVSLRTHAQKGLFALQIKNQYLHAPVTEQGRLRSGKKDARRHGFGTESIRAIAQKYGGTVVFHAADGTFECMLYMPLPGVSTF